MSLIFTKRGTWATELVKKTRCLPIPSQYAVVVQDRRMITHFRSQIEKGKLPLDKDSKKNLETHHIVDLLPDRQAATAAAWIKPRPDIMVVSRDRGGEYAKAAAVGAPQALDVADRFHILKNLTEALQLLLGRSLEEIKAANQTPEKEQDEPSKPVITMEEWRRAEPGHVRKARLARRSGRYARYQQVVELREQGMKPKEIARHLGIGERTVHRWLASGTFPEASKRRRQNAFEPFAPYVLSRS